MHFQTIQKITLIKVRGTKTSINENLQLLSNSLGLFSDRDKESSCFRIFVELTKRIKEDGLTSDELALKTNLSRATVLHHINKMMVAGIAILSKNKYSISSNNLTSLIKNLRNDTSCILNDLDELAKNLDKELKIK